MRGSQSRRKLFVESLESRRLLHGGGHDLPTPTLDAGVLSIAGSSRNDQIHVSVADTQLTVSFGKQSFEFNTAEVTEIHIDGGNGNDWIWVDDSVLVAAIINGGKGNDRIHSGGGDDTITGDKGNDRLMGGAGIDTMRGGSGKDWTWGGDGDDVIKGEA